MKSLSVSGVAGKRSEGGAPARRAGEQKSRLPLSALGRTAPRQEEGESLGDFAYRLMRESIRSGKFKSGEHLREADIAAWLAISRTPVREAFHRLITESLLSAGPWNGVMVAQLDAQQLIELYAVRESLEGTAAALAAQHATKAEIQLMLKIVRTEAREKDRPEKLVNINGDLHQTIYRATHNRYLLQSITTIVDALGLLRHSTFVLPGSVELAHCEHMKIITAIRQRDPSTAEKIAREHVRHALEMRLQLHARELAG